VREDRASLVVLVEVAEYVGVDADLVLQRFDQRPSMDSQIDLRIARRRAPADLLQQCAQSVHASQGILVALGVLAGTQLLVGAGDVLCGYGDPTAQPVTQQIDRLGRYEDFVGHDDTE
jgi:hypothetical protein